MKGMVLWYSCYLLYSHLFVASVTHFVFVCHGLQPAPKVEPLNSHSETEPNTEFTESQLWDLCVKPC